MDTYCEHSCQLASAREAVSSAILLGHTGIVIVCKSFSKDSLLIET
jgi:hypothetical protein